MRSLPILSLLITATLATTASAASYWSWGTSASAEAFENSLENSTDGILFENWPVDNWTIHIGDAQTFSNLVDDRTHLQNVISRRVLEICLDQNRDENRCYSARGYLRDTAWVQEDASGYIAAHRLALTFFEVDEDNWFSFDMMLDKTLDYLSTGRRELRLYKGFNAIGVIDDGGIGLPDLPVVIDRDEQTITSFSASLFD